MLGLLWLLAKLLRRLRSLHGLLWLLAKLLWWLHGRLLLESLQHPLLGAKRLGLLHLLVKRLSPPRGPVT